MVIPGFLAGFVAVLIFHQGLWYILHHIGFIPPDRPPWPLDPVPPLGVPSVISKAFWGGVWGTGLAPLFWRLRGARYWLAWILIGTVATTLTSLYLVSRLRANRCPRCGRGYIMPYSSTAPGALAPRGCCS